MSFWTWLRRLSRAISEHATAVREHAREVHAASEATAKNTAALERVATALEAIAEGPPEPAWATWKDGKRVNE